MFLERALHRHLLYRHLMKMGAGYSVLLINTACRQESLVDIDALENFDAFIT
jgi:hypothetical protein